MNRFFLSDDFVRDTGDVQLKGGRYVPELATGMVSTATNTLVVPSAVTPGTYKLIGCADSFDAQREYNESNNWRVADVAITVARPDFVTTTGDALAETGFPGGKLSISDTVGNLSAVEARASTTRYYLSFDTAKSATDVLLVGKRAVPILALGAVSTGTAKPSIPLGAAEGAQYVLACADDLKKVVESSESNNCKATAAPVLIGWPDLVTAALSNAPEIARPGERFRVTDTALNQGTVPAGASSTLYYLSLDTTKTASDVLLTGKRSVSELAPGTSSSGRKTVTIPLSIAPGDYFLLACADGADKIPERENANNCRASGATVVIQP